VRFESDIQNHIHTLACGATLFVSLSSSSSFS